MQALAIHIFQQIQLPRCVPPKLGAGVIIKATKVDGVYDSDPKKNPDAKKFDKMTYIDFLNRRLTVMDSTAVTLCMENNLPILVLNYWDKKALVGALRW